MTTVVLAEKPSVARDIARVLGARRKGEGLLEGNGYRVTWALGHLVHFAEPDDYGADWAGRWSSGQLPMIPERWRLRTDKRTANQYRQVKELLNAPDTERLVCATDAGREGEHIFRLIYEHARCKKPFTRLWVSSLTDEAIRDGFRALKPGADFDHLAEAARARAQADWLVGMNLTRAYTVHNRVLCTIGRVQTPTLAMIVRRDQVIANFTKVYFYELVAQLKEGFSAKYAKDGETRIDKRTEAEHLYRELSPNEMGKVLRLQKKVRRNHPPPLYDLTNLQRDANRRFGFTAAEVLKHAQALYETHKLISYPRTESRHISDDMLAQLPVILKGLQHPLAVEALQRLQAGLKLGKAYVDSTKLTDHHAIIPTGRVPSPGLTDAQRKVYELVATRFVEIFLPNQMVEETLVILDIGGAPFIARGSVVLDEGWKRADQRRHPNNPDGAADDGRVSVPPLEEGQTVHLNGMEVVEKETKPPKPYEDASLLAAMKNAGREIDDDALASTMKDSGLGTPATRAEMIEKLIRSGYVERRRKQLRATEKGRALVGLVAEPLCSAELTAQWEQRLKDVERGEGRGEDFYRDIVAFLRGLVSKVAQGPAMTPEQVAASHQSEPMRRGVRGKQGRKVMVKTAGLGTCPLCGKGDVTENAKAYGCSRYREGCGLTIWKTVAGLKFPMKLVRQLLSQGHTDLVDGFVSKAGRPFSARLKLSAGGKLELDFGQHSGHAAPSAPTFDATSAFVDDPSVPDGPLMCPKCGQGRIIEGRRGYGCNRYREGCDFVVWKEVSGIQLSEQQILTLIANGGTGIIRGFTDGRGNRLDGRLRLDGRWQVALDFVCEHDI